MGMSDAAAVPVGSPPAGNAAEVVWHDLECGYYRADLPLWRELAARHPGPILDIGAGTGRVALELARAGHSVTALEREPALLQALRARPGAHAVQTVCADARSFQLPEHHFALCVVPMQTIQLLGGAPDRARFLARARATLRKGGLLACAVLARVEPFACAAKDAGPAPETVLIDGLRYTSRPTRVAVNGQSVVIERERSVRALGELSHREHHGSRSIEPPIEHCVIELARLSARSLQREASAVGLRAEPPREVAPTEDHVGSTVVMLRA
jgi:SAM-dependent methyltransferase